MGRWQSFRPALSIRCNWSTVTSCDDSCTEDESYKEESLRSGHLAVLSRHYASECDPGLSTVPSIRERRPWSSSVQLSLRYPLLVTRIPMSATHHPDSHFSPIDTLISIGAIESGVRPEKPSARVVATGNSSHRSIRSRYNATGMLARL